MPTIFSHPAIALGLTPWFRDVRNSKAILATGMVLTVLPDIDVIGLYAGVPYEHMLGHRGLSHSLYIVAIISAIATWIFAFLMKIRSIAVWAYLFVCMGSHGVLDAMTNGGHGIAFFAPFSNTRYFFPWRPIEVSTLNIAHFFNGQGVPVLLSELLYLWPVCALVFAMGYGWHKNRPRP